MTHPQYTPKQVAYFEARVDRSGGIDACHKWTLAPNPHGYGRASVGGVRMYAHRLAWEIANGPIPPGLEVCHNCPDGDNPTCCNVAHLWLGTQAENVADMITKGRAAPPEQHRPKNPAHGDDHWSRKSPERVARGERNGARTHPERYPRGDDHYSRVRPEAVARGDDHWSRRHPERRARGEANGQTKLTAAKVLEMRALRAGGMKLQPLADLFEISKQTVSKILRRESWGHV